MGMLNRHSIRARGTTAPPGHSLALRIAFRTTGHQSLANAFLIATFHY